MAPPLFIVNPTAGRGRTRQLWPRLRSLLPSGFAFEEVYTEAPLQATQLAAEAARASRPAVFAVGGDGTVAEVASGLAGTGVPLGVVPTGTGCDFARSLGVAASAAYLGQIERLRPRAIDLGEFAGRHFLNVAGAGFDAEVADAVNRSRLQGGAGGTLPYLSTIVRTLARYRPRPAELRLDGRRINVDLFLVAVANGRYYAGGMRIAPAAELDDGLFDVVVIGPLTARERFRILPSMYRGGHVGRPKVTIHRAQQVELQSAEALKVHLDGEVVGTSPALLACRPRALTVLVPPR